MSGKRERILVIDDDAAIRSLLKEHFEGFGYQVSVCRDGREAIVAFTKNKPDALVVDFLLPSKNGMQVIETLREESGTDTPVVLISGVLRDQRTILDTQKSHSALEFLPKPIDLSVLHRTIRKMLSDKDSMDVHPSTIDVGMSEDSDTIDLSVDEQQSTQRIELADMRPFPLLSDEGSLSEYPVALVLSILSYDRETGILDLSEGSAHRRIYVRDGEPTFLQSNAEGENVAALLLSRGRLTRPDMARCAEYMKEKSQTLQRALLELKLVTEDELARAYTLLAGELLPKILATASGTYKWRRTDAFMGRVPEGHYDLMTALFQGVRDHIHPAIVLEFFRGRENVPLVKTPRFALCLRNFRRVFRVQNIADQIDGKHSYRMFTEHPGAEASSILPQLYAVATSGMVIVQASSNPSLAEEDVCLESEELELDVEHKNVWKEGSVNDETEDTRLQIKRFHQDVMNRDFFEVFSVDTDATTQRIRSIYFDLAKKWHRDAYVGVDLGQEEDQLNEIFGRISEAYNTLTNPKLREEYLLFIERKGKGLATNVEEVLEAEHLFDQAEALMRKKAYGDAQRCLEKATKLNPGDPNYLTMLGWAVYRTDQDSPVQIARAVEILKRVAKEFPRNSDALRYLGQIHFTRKKYREALKWWTRCVDVDPKCVEASRGIRLIGNRAKKRREETQGLLGRVLKKK